MSLPLPSEKLNTLMQCLPDAPFKTHMAEEIKAYGQACRAAALEEAAQICSHKAETKRLFLNEAHYLECAEAIRRLK